MRRGIFVRIFLTIVIAATVLIIYVMMEKKFAQRACFSCGSKISLENEEQKCSRCGAFIG
jgi:hypothetical protein